MEAAWRILELPLHGRSHFVLRLPVHLEGQQQKHLKRAKREAIKKNKAEITPLLGWFELNKIDHSAKKILYGDIPLYYRWDLKSKCWIRRKNIVNVVTRIVAVSPKDVERFHLKLILTKIYGATSYSFLKTLNCTTYSSFREAAVVLGLTVNSDEALEVMKEASEVILPARLREFFVRYIIGEMPPDALSLWQNFKNTLCEDFQNCADPEKKALIEIEKLSNFEGMTGTTFRLPYVDVSDEVSDNCCDKQTEIKEHEKISNNLIPQLNEEQTTIFNNIMDSIMNNNPFKCFFIDGPGGTGKTFLYNALLHSLKSIGKNVANVAWTGIASIILPGGITSHKLFSLPINSTDNHISELEKRDKERLYAMEVIIWDEASMIPGMALETVDRTLRDLMEVRSSLWLKIFHTWRRFPSSTSSSKKGVETTNYC